MSSQEQKKKELEELNAMLAEMGVAPKENDGETGTAPVGKKKKKKDKAAGKEQLATAANGNGVVQEESKHEEPSAEQSQEEPIEVHPLAYTPSMGSVCSADAVH